jgi:hypothetical protein
MLLSKARKHVGRVGLQAIKVLFTVEGVHFINSSRVLFQLIIELLLLVKKVKLSSSVVIPDNAKISVCFERGGKLAATKEKVLKFLLNI